MLVADCLDYSGRYREARLQLNEYLGNNNGSFCTYAKDFSKTSRANTLQGTGLHAKLKTVDREWKDSAIDIGSRVQNVGGCLKWERRLRTPCRNLRLEEKTTLIADCFGPSGFTESRLDLDTLLGNRDGTFRMRSSGFSPSARNVSLETTVLQAKLQMDDRRWTRATLDLSRLIGNEDGRLVEFWGCKYQPLDVSCRQIRVLELSPVRSYDNRQEKHVYTMATVSLDDDVSFDALSYVWGSTKNPETIIVDGRPVSITRNLFDALDQIPIDGQPITVTELHGETKAPPLGPDGRRMPRYIWIDAVRIDQSNSEERGQQVELMRDIYRRAEVVHIWLGPADGTTREFFQTVAEMYSDSKIPEGSNGITVARPWSFAPGFRQLISHEWWARVWVIQEAHLARVPMLWCGNCGLPLQLMRHVFQLFQDAWRVHGIAACIGGVGEGVSSEEVLHLQYIFGTDSEAVAADPLSFLYVTNWRCRCSDPRDRIYGLLGLLPTSFGITPDYKLDVKSVYEQSMVKIMQHTSSLQMLTLCKPCVSLPTTTEPGWPSWVVDFRSIQGGVSQLRGSSANAIFSLKYPKPGSIVVRAWTEPIAAFANADPVLYSARGEMSRQERACWRDHAASIRSLIRESSSSSNRPSGILVTAAAAWRLLFPQLWPWLAYWFRRNILRNSEQESQPSPKTPTPLETHIPATYLLAETLKAHLLADRVLDITGLPRDVGTTSGASCKYSYFRTGSGRVGYVLKQITSEDVLAVIAGAEAAFILRGVGAETFEVVGDCYCDGELELQISVPPG